MTVSDLAIQYGAASVEPLSKDVTRVVFNAQSTAFEFYAWLIIRHYTPYMIGKTVYFSGWRNGSPESRYAIRFPIVDERCEKCYRMSFEMTMRTAQAFSNQFDIPVRVYRFSADAFDFEPMIGFPPLADAKLIATINPMWEICLDSLDDIDSVTSK